MEESRNNTSNYRTLSQLETFMKENGIERHLTFKQEMALMERIHKSDEEAFQELKKSNSILVMMGAWINHRIALKQNLDYPKLLEELLNAGYAGLMEGCKSKSQGILMGAAGYAELMEELKDIEELKLSREQSSLIQVVIAYTMRYVIDARHDALERYNLKHTSNQTNTSKE